MDKLNKDIMNVSKEDLQLVQLDERIHDKKFDTKPIGYFKDALIRFRKNKSSVVAAFIILLIVLVGILTPLFSPYGISDIDTMYARKISRNLALSKIGIATGCVTRKSNNKQYAYLMGIGIGVADKDGLGSTFDEGLDAYEGAVKAIGEKYQSLNSTDEMVDYRDLSVDMYQEVGFVYKQFTKAQYDEIRAWEEETGLQVLYPMVDTTSLLCDNVNDANYWYMTYKKDPIRLATEEDPAEIVERIYISKDGARYGFDVVYLDLETEGLQENYLRNADGSISFGRRVMGDSYACRVLYYNYYIYQWGHEPEFLLGTDVQGYDLLTRLSAGIRLSLLLSISVFAINFIIGAIYGAIEGYYGGWADMIMERISDILSGVPFIVVATLFQLHLAQKWGPFPSLIFAFVLTGWIGTAYRVRTQFYRYKGQEYILAARTLGAGDIRLMFKHIFPNTLGTIITSSVLAIPGVIFSESMLSYLGIVNLGGSTSTSIGTMLADAQPYLTTFPHLILWPSIIISLLMICFNLFGNGLRDAFNPSLRGVED